MAEVAIVGAGLAGLNAARKLVERDVDVRVYEARDRVGGRTLSHQAEHGETIDLGAQWLGPTQHRLAKIVDELALTRVKQHHEGKKALLLDGRVRTYSSDIPSLPILALLDLGRTISRVERLAKKIDARDPLALPNARELDSMTVEEWRRSNVHTKAASAMVDVVTKAVFAVEPRQLSLLFFLTYLQSGGGLMKLSTIPDGAQETRVAEGFQTVSLRFAEALGDRVKLESPVRAIVQDDDGVTIVTDEEQKKFDRVIVAVPPALAGRIRYEPALPTPRDQLTQRMPMGSVIKCIAFYEEPFWRKDGWSGEVVADDGPVRIVFDDSPGDASSGALLGFIAGDDALHFSGRPVEERRRVVLDVFARFFGERAKNPTSYVDQDWCAETYSRGCYTGVLGPGVMSEIGDALRAPVGRIHWAGTETAFEHMGYMEGALESGERAAEEVLARV